MSPKEVALLLAILLVSSVGALAYTDVYPPEGWTEDRSNGAASGLANEGPLQNEDIGDPTATPTETSSEPPATFPRGLSRDEVENPTVLSRTHRDILLEAGSWTRHLKTTVYANGTETATSVRTEKVSMNGSRAAGKTIVKGKTAGELGLYGPDLAYWSNESVTLVNFIESNHTSAIERDDRYPVPFDVESTQWWTLYQLFGQTNTTFEGSVDHGETTVYRIGATKSWYFDSPYGNVRDLSLSALVTSEGLVKEYVVTFLREEIDHETRVVVHVEYTNVGTTTVDRPAWVPKNLDNISQAPDTATDAGYDSIGTDHVDVRGPTPSNRLAGDQSRFDSPPIASRVAQ
jgi:hypothetical protein